MVKVQLMYIFTQLEFNSDFNECHLINKATLNAIFLLDY